MVLLEAEVTKRRRMHDKDSGLRQRITLDCEFRLVEAMEEPESQDDWLVVDKDGSIYYAILSVDERLDCPVVDVCDAQTGNTVRRYAISVNCRSLIPSLPSAAFPKLGTGSGLLEPFELDTDSGVDVGFRQFTSRVDRDTLAKQAETILKQGAFGLGSASVFANYPGGLVGFTIRKLVVEAATTSGNPTDYLRRVDELTDRLVAHYAFAKEWVPPRLLVREALALTVRRREVMRQLEKQVGECRRVLQVLEQGAAAVEGIKNAFLLSDESVDDLLRGLDPR